MVEASPQFSLPPLVYEQRPGAASVPVHRPYRRRQPETTALYGVVRDHLDSFLDHSRQADPNGEGLPAFIEREFRRYLACGQLAGGFARLRCPSCGHERLVAFSCKGRLCPSCWSRRAADTAADLVDRVLPVAPYRQWVLAFPWDLRYPLATDRAFLSAVLRAFVRCLIAFQRARGRRLGIPDGHTGSVSFVQRFTASLSLYPHLHVLAPDGLFVPDTHEPDGPLRLCPLPPPTDSELVDFTRRLAKRLAKVARRHLVAHDDAGDELPERALLRHWAAEALRSPAGQGPPSPPPMSAEPCIVKPLTVRFAGLSLNASHLVPANDRGRLERLCRYGLRAPFSVERFSRLPDGRIRYELRKPASNGTTHADFEPLALLRRLAALLPAPYTHLVRYHGVFAGRAKLRPRLPPPPPASDAQPPAPTPTPPPDDSVGSLDSLRPLPERARRRRTPWARLLMRVLDVDALTCPKCASPMLVLAFLTDPLVVRRILAHLDLPTALPAPQVGALHVEPEPDQLYLDYEHSQLPPEEQPAGGRDPPS